MKTWSATQGLAVNVARDDEDAEFDFQGALKSRGPGALSGAAQGASAGAVAGPWGALIGAGIGATASLASQPKRPGNHPAAPASPPVSALPVAPALAPARGPSVEPQPASPPPAANAVAQLLALLAAPEIRRAAEGAASGSPGTPVEVGGQGGTRVSPDKLLALLGAVASQAAAEAEAFSDGDDSYLRDEYGEYVCDPVVAGDRHRILHGLLTSARPASAQAWLANALT